VSLRLPSRFVLALALLVGVQGAYVNPGVAAAELRAMACCAHECDEPLSLPTARHCCGVTAVASGPAEAHTGQAVGPVAMLVLQAPRIADRLPTADHPIVDRGQVAGAGPPTFLEQRHLLL
jgi:hypothetical protein